jgi:hypothetical protein
MIRKSLFWGLTLVLIVALVTLVIRGRRFEKQQAAKVVAVTRESKSTPTKVLSPQDLEIVDSTKQANFPNTAEHGFVIRNIGSIPYSRLQLEFVYLDRGGRVVANRSRLIERTVMPGTSIEIADIKNEAIPASAVESRILILSADMGPDSSSGQR